MPAPFFALTACNALFQMIIYLTWNKTQERFDYMVSLHKKSRLILLAAAAAAAAVSTAAVVIRKPGFKKLVDLSYGPSDAQKVDLYLPKVKKSKCTAVVIYIHGGGWTGGDKADCDSYCTKTAERGYAAASMNYRMLGDGATLADMLADITSAMELVKSTAAQNGFTLTQAAIAGGSAGGHLAMLYCYKNQALSPIKIAFCVSQCGPSKFTDIRLYEDGEDPADKYALISALINQKVDKTTFGDLTAELQAISPVNYITKDSPPTIVIQGQKDELVRYSQGVDVFDAFYETGGVCDLILFPNSGHALDSDPDQTERYNRLFMAYEKKYFGY